MAFAFRRITSSKYQEISDAAASFSAKAQLLQIHGTIQTIKAVNQTTGEITEAIAYKDSSRGGSLVVKYAKDSMETSASNIESTAGTSTGVITGWINVNYGDAGGGGGDPIDPDPGPVFEIYYLYQYSDAKEACEFGTKGNGKEPIKPVEVYLYKTDVFSDSKGQSLFDGSNSWFYVTDLKGNPVGESWNIDSYGVLMDRFMCK